MGDYAAKELKYKRAAMIADDIAYGHELNAGFQRAFEDAGGKVVQKLWSPLVTPDYGTYISQIKDNIDVLFIGFAGAVLIIVNIERGTEHCIVEIFTGIQPLLYPFFRK